MQLTKENLLAALPETDTELKIQFGVLKKGGYNDHEAYVPIPRMLNRFDSLMAKLKEKGRIIKSGDYWMVAGSGISVHQMDANELLQSFIT